MKVVVTGGAGFIGANLCARLLELDKVTQVLAFDDLSTGIEANLAGLPVDLVVGSVLDEVQVRKALFGASIIVHLAARPSVPRSIAEPLLSHEANATGTLRVLDAARSLNDPYVVVASSSSVYGANPDLPKVEGMTPMPMSPYAVSKLAGEQYSLAWRHSYGMRTIAFRFFNVFGPLQSPDHDYAAVVPKFIDAALRDDQLVIYGDGQQSRDFTYVGTVCEAIATAVSDGSVARSPVNLAFGTRTSLVQLVALLERILGKELRVSHTETRAGDVLHSQADSSLLRSLMPDLEPIELETGLRTTIDWMARQTSHSR